MDGLARDEMPHCWDPGLDWERTNITYRWARAHSLELLLPIPRMRRVVRFGRIRASARILFGGKGLVALRCCVFVAGVEGFVVLQPIPTTCD